MSLSVSKIEYLKTAIRRNMLFTLQNHNEIQFQITNMYWKNILVWNWNAVVL
jgi:hypothetical protein